MTDQEEDEIRDICTPVHLKCKLPFWLVALFIIFSLSILLCLLMNGLGVL